LKKGDRVQLVGFGTFSVSKRKARNGRNPQTGDVIKIAAHRAAKFSAGSELKTMLNGKKLKTHTTGTTMPSYGDPTTE
jgi:DNA-binding protein HU-beta